MRVGRLRRGMLSIGNRFRKGHRIRLVILGASGASTPSAPALNTIQLGGGTVSRLLLTVPPAERLMCGAAPVSASGRSWHLGR